MASKKLTNTNKATILADWISSATNRGDTLYYITDDINILEIMSSAFNGGILVLVTPVDTIISKITFVTTLT